MKGTALVTGGARRLGAAISTELHAAGYRVLVHSHRSRLEGEWLVARLNEQRADSALLLTGDLAQATELDALVASVRERAPDLGLLVNNAAAFFPTPLASATALQWNELVDTNLRAPFLLAQGLHALLVANRGSIVNLADIYAERPLREHSLYAMTKAGIVALTRSLARDLAPAVRVNAVAPGAILWPDDAGLDYRTQLIAKIPLGRTGEAGDVARAVRYLAEAEYVTGQVLAVDGGRSLNM